MKKGTVLRIERISPNDGMGLRTVVFLKGCPLRCAWCSTPESHSKNPEWFYKQAKCRHCAKCIQTCPQHALAPSADRTAVVRDKTKCVNCFQCASVCLTHAIGIYGQDMRVDEVMKEIRKDSLFYFHSGGGVTLSGGDVLMQADFAQELLKACRDECINTSAELDMYGAYANVQKLLPYLNSYFVDIKHMDGAMHKQWTGVDNATILSNIQTASAEFPQVPLYARVPLIPGVNDQKANILATAAFCSRLPSCQSLEFLPFHRLGAAAYQYTDRPYAFAEQQAMTAEEAAQKIACLRGKALPYPVKVAGKIVV